MNNYEKPIIVDYDEIQTSESAKASSAIVLPLPPVLPVVVPVPILVPIVTVVVG